MLSVSGSVKHESFAMKEETCGDAKADLKKFVTPAPDVKVRYLSSAISTSGFSSSACSYSLPYDASVQNTENSAMGIKMEVGFAQGGAYPCPNGVDGGYF